MRKMLQTTTMETVVLPHVIRINRIPFIAMTAIFPPLITAILVALAWGNPLKDIIGWCAGLLIAIVFSIWYLAFITQEIRLSEQKISYRQWFFLKEMQYGGISEIRCYYRYVKRGPDRPVLEILGKSGETIPINLLPFLNRKNMLDIFNVLQGHVPQADLKKCWKELFSESDDSAGYNL
jgi:hypothetical protein